MADTSSIHLFLLPLLLALSVINSSVKGQQCQSIQLLSTDEQSSASCSALDDCNGMTCVNTERNRIVTFSVDNCQDPVLVNVTVSDSNNSIILARVLNESLMLGFNSSYQFNFTMSRNASHLFVSSHLTITGTGYTLVPQTIVNLNASDCMCQSIQSIADNGESPVETNCVNNTECTGLECTFSVSNLQYKIESDIQPCSTPPGFIFIVRDLQTGSIIFDQFFNSSSNSVLFFFPLRVTVIHRNYSMIVAVDLDIAGVMYHLVPRTQIILDKSKCPTPPPPANLQPTPTPAVPVSPQTCDSLKTLANNSVNNQCTTNRACNTLQCSIIGYRSSFTVLPCNNPPGFHVSIYNPNNMTIYDGIITNTTTVPLSEQLGLYLIIVVSHGRQDSLGLQIKLRTSFSESVVVPENSIRLNRCTQCTNVPCTSPTNTPEKESRSSNIALEISIPVVFLLTVGIAVVAVLAVIVLVLFRRRHSNENQFAFSEMDDDIDDTDKL